MSNNFSTTLPLVIINGRAVETLSIFDRAFQYGDGLFETIAVLDGKPALLIKHLQRLENGLDRLKFPAIDIETLKKDIQKFSSQFKQAVLKLTITRGESQRGYKVPQSPSPNIIFSFSDRSFRLHVDNSCAVSLRYCDTPVCINPALAGIKHLNRLEQVLARNEWHDEVYDDGLMSDTDGRVIESTSANVFLFREGSLLTPDLSLCGIAGVAREVVLEQAKGLAIPCKIQDISIEECHDADALFLTNSLSGIMPVENFESTTYRHANWPDQLFDKVMQHVFT